MARKTPPKMGSRIGTYTTKPTYSRIQPQPLPVERIAHPIASWEENPLTDPGGFLAHFVREVPTHPVRFGVHGAKGQQRLQIDVAKNHLLLFDLPRPVARKALGDAVEALESLALTRPDDHDIRDTNLRHLMVALKAIADISLVFDVLDSVFDGVIDEDFDAESVNRMYASRRYAQKLPSLLFDESIVHVELNTISRIIRVVELSGWKYDFHKAVLEAANNPHLSVPKEHRAVLVKVLSRSFETWLDDQLAGVEIEPDLTQPLYKDRDRAAQTAIWFFEDTYKDERPFADQLRRHDKQLYAALSVYLSRNKKRGMKPDSISDLMPVRAEAAGGSLSNWRLEDAPTPKAKRAASTPKRNPLKQAPR